MSSDMTVTEVGDTYVLRREQWKGNTAKISKDTDLLEEVKKYTWTYSGDKHPYLHNKKLNKSLHEFVLNFIYGAENIEKMKHEKNIIEYLDNDGLNCTYENLHILSDDMNKVKAFSIDKERKGEEEVPYQPYIMDVYYLHKKKMFQMQIFMNEPIYSNTTTGNIAAMFICLYSEFEDLFLDWFYLLRSRSEKRFDYTKFHTENILVNEFTPIQVSSEEKNSPFIMRDGVVYVNLDANVNGVPVSSLCHTSLRRTAEEEK